MTYLAIAIFGISFLLIVLEAHEKSLIALCGALLMILLGILTPAEALSAIDHKTILLLMAMMLLVNIASKSGIFEWINLKIASFTKGNPALLFLLFAVLTAISSAFLDNVTTVILIVPLTIQLVKGMGKDPKPYIFAEIIFANMGGALTLIGDPSNIIIGGATGFSFMQFIANLWVPILMSALFTLLVFNIIYRRQLKKIVDDLVDLCIANILIKQLKHKFLKIKLEKSFIIKVVTVILLTFTGFFLQKLIGLPTYIIAFTAAIVLALMSRKQVSIHHAFSSVEWTTLFFFAGLFIMVGAVEKTGALEQLSEWISSYSTDLLVLSLMILWVSGFASMALDNIPFVTVMVPVIAGIQSHLVGVEHTDVLWWSLTLGACLGGSGTLVGASANVVSADIARKNGVHISFMEYTKFAFPLTIGILTICSIYLFVRIRLV